MLALKSQLIGAALVLAFCSENLYAAHAYMGNQVCSVYSKLLPRNKDYKKHCEAETGPDGADPKWPCFTFWNEDLTEVNPEVQASKPFSTKSSKSFSTKASKSFSTKASKSFSTKARR